MKCSLSSFEGELVKYYDMFFLREDKVKEEVTYIRNLTNKSSNLAIWGGKLIDVGCGTGCHALEFSEYFNKITALDISSDMIEYARKNHFAKNIDYICQDIRGFETTIKYNMAVALSHVIGYQLDNLSVEKMLLNVNRTLEKEGIFLFNFYNAPALFQGGLKSQYKKVQSEHTVISRFSNAAICAEENELLLDYYYIIEETENGNLINLEIHEKMRYFTEKEIEYYLYKAGFEIVKFFNYGADEKLSTKEWNAGVIACKIQNL